uniref:Family with sequence similarity 120 member B n=1 Tax=Oryzias sinensis TaxID=183150 RepID=A0A8C7Y2S8_9TELE
MGVKGLQSFMERCCPEACVTVNLREMARRHAAQTQQDPTLVVDGMACLCHWYSCEDWVCGGQWKEYVDVLKSWVDAFTSAGIQLVFFFDGVVEQRKRQEWIKRRRRVNGDVSKIFRHIKEHGEKPHKELFCLPSALATFTPFALRFLGKPVFCSVREADYEIASYARQYGSMGILGQDSDFIIYDSVPYFSVAKLRINSLTTVMYDRERLCRTIGLPVTLLPLLACLLGNDVVSEEQMQSIRNNAMATYRKNCSASRPCAPQGQMVVALTQLLRSLSTREEEDAGSVLQSLNLTASQRDLVQQGIFSYLLPGQNDFKLFDGSETPSAFEKHINPEILKACRQKHVAAEGFMVYNVVCAGVTECSNSLEDEEDTELLPQAVVYKPCRQRIYGLLLLGQDANTSDVPAVKEWFVYPGNPLKEPDMVHPVTVNLPCGRPCLEQLWFGNGPEVFALRLATFFLIFDCSEYTELYGAIENSLLAALCLVTYIVQQVESLSEEDVDAYLSQALCLKLYSPQQLQNIELPALSSRAVQLGSLFVRGLSHLLGANTASGGPLRSDDLMPWHSFDGRLFHSKYLLAHSGKENSELLDNNMSCISLFLQMKEQLLETCKKRGRILQSRPRATQQHLKATATGFSLSAGERGRGRGGTSGGHRGRWGWRERGEDRRDRSGSDRPCDRAGNQDFHSFYPNYQNAQHQDMSWRPRLSRGPSRHLRGDTIWLQDGLSLLLHELSWILLTKELKIPRRDLMN